MGWEGFGECERRFEVFVKMQKKIGGGGGGGLGRGVRIGGPGVKIKKKKKKHFGVVGSGWGGSGWV